MAGKSKKLKSESKPEPAGTLPGPSRPSARLRSRIRSLDTMAVINRVLVYLAAVHGVRLTDAERLKLLDILGG